MSRLRLSALDSAKTYPLVIPGLKACNPSLSVGDEGFLCIIRTVNYDLDRHGRGLVAPGVRVESFSWLAHLDADFRITRLEWIDDSAVGIDRQPWNRLEDCRLFRWKDAWWFIATWVLEDMPPACQIALCRLEGSKVVEWHLLPSPVNARIEKNWMPAVKDAVLRCVYWIEPTEILTYRQGNELESKYLGCTGRLAGWRGSSQCVDYRGNLLCVVHLRKKRKAGLSFSHRFIEMTNDFHVTRVSRPFVFEAFGVEYCAGLCVTDDDAILSYGVHDREARLMRISLTDVESMLHPFILPQSWALSLAYLRQRVTKLFRYRWLRHPRKQMRAAMERWRIQ